MFRLTSPVFRVATRSARLITPSVTAFPKRFYSAELDPANSSDYNKFVDQWVAHFKTADDFELERGLNHIFAADWIPAVPVIEEALHASRRLNTFATAVRVLEGLEEKCQSQKVFDQYLRELKPVLDEYGVTPLKDLGDFKPLEDTPFWLHVLTAKISNQVAIDNQHIAKNTMDRYDEEFESTSKLIVALRIRPMSKKELLKEATVIATPIDNKTVAVIDPFDDAFDDVLRRSRKREWRYNFDIVFPDTALQIEVYEKTTKPQIDWVLNGFNASVFAYGATGAGKTHTMLGTESNPGVMALALIDLFDRIDNRNIVRPSNQSVKSGKTKLNGVYDVSMSYLEIYNENIRDLLSSKPGYLDLREDSKGGITVTGITRINARSADEILTQLRLGNKIRTQEATGANEVSSRSHAVLQILVKHKFVNENGISCANVGKLSMIDLAGSERAAETNNKGIRMKEGANINRSLLALSNCINALVDNKKGKFINFRDSKLTRLLKDSLIGNCRTVMIANIGPSSHHFDETQNTLKYASRARYIETKPTENLTMKNDPYNAALINLRSEVHNLKEKLEDEYEEVIAPSKQKLGHMRHQSDNVNTKSKKRNETHSRKPTNNDDGGGSSMLRRSLASTPFTEIVSKSTTNAGNNSFEKVTNTLDSIFQRQLECRNELIKTDSQIAEYVILIDEKNMELENLKAQTARSNNANNIQALESNLMSQRRSLDEIVAKHRKDLLAKINFQKDMQNLDAKVRDIQRVDLVIPIH
ncbi:Kinesin-like protein kif19 [Nowakowskiella sp. JEL0407]|nr:Kinesin-like protein kif19 [Nowakowskiella sp. JEL0407]